MKTFIILSSLAFSLFAVVSASAYDGRPDSYENRIYKHARALNRNMLRECQNCTFAESQNADPMCRSQYDRVFGKPVVNVHVAFGYMDDSEHLQGHRYAGKPTLPNESFDGGARDGMIYQLTRPCRGENGACGFQRSPDSQFLLTKMIQYRGQDTLVQLHLTQGSATPWLHVNIGEGKGRQALATHISNENFFGSLSTSDLTVYNGHARSGGGPDFNPPVRRADGHPDYAGYYRIQQPGLRTLISSLQRASAHPPLMALLACDSDDLFRRSILKAAPKMGLVTTSDLVHFEDSFMATFLVVDGFLRQECRGTFEKTLATLKTDNGAYLKLNNFLENSY